MNGNKLLKKLLDKREREILIELGSKLMDVIYKNIHNETVNKEKDFYKDGDGRIVFIYLKKKKKIFVLQSDRNFFIRIFPIDNNKYNDILKHWLKNNHNLNVRYIDVIENTSFL